MVLGRRYCCRYTADRGDGVTSAPAQQSSLKHKCLLLRQLMLVGVGWIGAVIKDYSKNVLYVIFTDFGKHRVREGFSSYYSLWPF